MPLLPSLIRRVNEFLKAAEQYSLVSLGADDTSLLAQLMDASKEVVNPEVAYNLKLLRAMYQKAIEINGGFRTIYQAVQGMIEDLDPEEEESESVSRLLNQISNQIEKRAARSDSPGDMRELQMAASTIRAAEDSPFTYEDPEEEEGGMSAYEASLLGYSGTKDEGGEKEEMAKFLPGGGAEPTDKKRGWGVGKAYTYKDWAQVYNEERTKYDRDLNGPTELLTTAGRIARNDVRIQSNLRDLIKILDRLSALTTKALVLETQIAKETEIAHPKEDAELAEIHGEMRLLESQRNSLKRNLNKFYKQNEIDSIREKINRPGITPQQRRLLEQKLKLQELRVSGKYGYGKEAKERIKLIEALTADPNLKDDQIQKMEESISGAAQFTDRMTKAQYDRAVTETRGKEQARESTPTYEATRGGRRVPMERLPKEQQIDLEKMSFSALVYQFQIDIASATQAARQAVYEIKSANKGSKGVKKQINTEYKSIVDAISDAIRKSDRNALQIAKQQLVDVVSQDAAVYKYELKGYIDVIRLEPHFRKILESIKEVTKNPSKKELKDNPSLPSKLDDNGNIIPDNFSEADRAILQMILNDMVRLRTMYAKYYINIASLDRSKNVVTNDEWWKIKKQINARFTKVVDDMKKIEVRLLLDLKAHPPETRMKLPERSQELQNIWRHLEKTDPKRFEKEKAKWQENALKSKSSNERILLLKAAQEAGGKQEVDQATADRLANELAENIVDQIYQSILGELGI